MAGPNCETLKAGRDLRDQFCIGSVLVDRNCATPCRQPRRLPGFDTATGGATSAHLSGTDRRFLSMKMVVAKAAINTDETNPDSAPTSGKGGGSVRSIATSWPASPPIRDAMTTHKKSMPLVAADAALRSRTTLRMTSAKKAATIAQRMARTRYLANKPPSTIPTRCIADEPGQDHGENTSGDPTHSPDALSFSTPRARAFGMASYRKYIPRGSALGFILRHHPQLRQHGDGGRRGRCDRSTVADRVGTS
jgi:hypothetical protein